MDEVQLDDGLSEDWPKEFSELKELEKLLRCNICKDFMKTALITGCSHLFCSYCIRQSIQYRNQCPACFAELYDNQLRPERTLDEVVRIFTSVKRKMLKRLQISYAACPEDEGKVKPPATQHTTTQEQHNKAQAKMSTSVLLFNSPRKLNPAESPAIVKHRTVPDMFSPRKLCSSQSSKPGSSSMAKQISKNNNETPAVTEGTVGSVPCPVCNVEIPNKHINLHLDECLARANGAPPKSQPMNKPSRDPLPKLVLSLMKEKELKHYCKKYSLSMLGDRKCLITRIQRFTTLYNSECDSLNPRSTQDIIRQIEREDKSITSNATAKPLFSQITRKTDPKIIEEANTKYLQDNKTAFQKLIENMKSKDGENIVRCPRPSISRILSDDEEDVEPEPAAIAVATTPKSRIINKGGADNQSSTPTRNKKTHPPPLSPEIKVAISPSQNRSGSPLPGIFQSPSLIDYMSPIERSSTSSTLTSSTPMIPNSTPKLTSSNKNTNISSILSKTPSKNPNQVLSSLCNNFSKTDNVSKSVDKFESFVSEFSPTSASSKKQSRTDKARDTESPDLFLAEGMEEEELAPSGGSLPCTSPDLLGNLNSSCSHSQKLQVTSGGHFLFLDSDSDRDDTKTTPTNSQGNKSALNGCLDNREKSRASCESNNLINGGDSDDDEDFLQLVQNRRAKRKPKQTMFSPRTTRSKRVKP